MRTKETGTKLRKTRRYKLKIHGAETETKIERYITTSLPVRSHLVNRNDNEAVEEGGIIHTGVKRRARITRWKSQ